MDEREVLETGAPEKVGTAIVTEPLNRAFPSNGSPSGLMRLARREAEEQEKAEEATRAEAPEAYRLSSLSSLAFSARYRRGKDAMDEDDLLRYVADSRPAAPEDLAEAPGVYESAVPVPVEKKEPLPTVREESGTVRKTVRELGTYLKNRQPTWFNTATPDNTENRRTFPLSAFAAAVVVAVSMMLIVASSLMVTRAESGVSRLNEEISDITGEIADLRADMESNEDLLRIREIAVTDYGMIGEDFLKMDHLSLASPEGIESFTPERNEGIGLSALLSAIGIRK